jgi:hypothetical protein
MPAVPKLIHFIWAGGTKLLPPENAKRIKAWAKKNPGFEVVLWIDSASTPKDLLDKYNQDPYRFNDDPKIVLRDISDEKEKIADEYSRYHIDKMVPNYGSSSDIIRYAILKKYGGALFDSDVLVDDKTKPLNYDDLFESSLKEILKINQFTQNARSIGNDGFICTPGHPFMVDLYETAKKNHLTMTRSIYGEYGTYDYLNHGMYDFDSIEKLYGKQEEPMSRIHWTIDCTGPGAVRQVCKERDMLAVGPNPGEFSTTDPSFALDAKTFKPATRNDGNWLTLNIKKYSNPEDAIEAAVNEIKFEAKYMGFLGIDYHIQLIMKALQPPSLTQEEVAVKLVEALKKNALDLSAVSLVQLFSIHPVVREYYRQYTPHADDNLQACELSKYSWDTSDEYFSQISSDAERSAVVDYTKHILNLVKNTFTTNPDNITMVHLSKLLLANHFLAKVPAKKDDSSVSDTKKEIDLLIQQILGAGKANELATQLQALLANEEQNGRILLAIARIGIVTEGRLVSEMLELFKDKFSAMNADGLSQNLCTLYKSDPSLVTSQFMKEVGEQPNPVSYFYNIFSSITCLKNISPCLVNNENIKLLAGASKKDMSIISSGLSKLFKASIALANNTTLKLLAAQGEHADKAASSLIDLYKQLTASASHSMGMFHLPVPTVNKMMQFISGNVGVSFDQSDIDALNQWKFESKYGQVIKLDSLPREEQPKPGHTLSSV